MRRDRRLGFTDLAGHLGSRTSTVGRQGPDDGIVQWVEICRSGRMFSTNLRSQGLTFLLAQVVGDPFGSIAKDVDHRLGIDAQYRRRCRQLLEEGSASSLRPRCDHGDELVTALTDIDQRDVVSCGEDPTERVHTAPQNPDAYQHHAVKGRSWRRGGDPDHSGRQQLRPAPLHHPGRQPQHGSSLLGRETTIALQRRNQPAIPFIQAEFHR